MDALFVRELERRAPGVQALSLPEAAIGKMAASKTEDKRAEAQSKRADDALNDAVLALQGIREKSETAAIEALMLAARLCREPHRLYEASPAY